MRWHVLVVAGLGKQKWMGWDVTSLAVAGQCLAWERPQTVGICLLSPFVYHPLPVLTAQLHSLKRQLAL